MFKSRPWSWIVLVTLTWIVVEGTAMTFVEADESDQSPCLGLGSTQEMDASGRVVAFDIGGDYAATVDSLGLRVWTFTDQGVPVRRGTWAPGRGFYHFEKYIPSLEIDPRGWAYVAGWESGFFIIDIRDPDRPELVFESLTEGRRKPDGGDQHLWLARNPVLLGDVLFVENGDMEWLGSDHDGCVFLDVQDPQRPRPVSTELPRSRGYVGVLNQLLVNIDRNLPFPPHSLNFWDISNISAPQLVGVLPGFPGGSPGVLLSGETYGLMDGYIGVHVWEYGRLGLLDLSDPANPQYHSYNHLHEDPFGWFEAPPVVFHASSMFAAAFSTYGPVLDWVDITEPESPTLRKRLLIPVTDPIMGLAIRDGLLYAALNDGGMRVFDIDDDLAEVFEAPSGGVSSAIAFHEGRAVIPHGRLGLKVFDIDPTNRLVLRGHLPLQHRVVDIDIAGDLAAVRGETRDGESVVYLVDLSDPDNPSLESTISFVEPLRDFTLDNHTLVTAEMQDGDDSTYYNWEVHDVASASEPILVSLGEGWGHPRAIDLRDGLLVLNYSGSASLVDLNDPANPVLLSSFNTDSEDRTSVALTDNLVVVGSYFYSNSVSYWGVAGWDISDPVDPVLVPESRVPVRNALNLGAFGNMVVASSRDTSYRTPTAVTLIDYEDPRNPSVRTVLSQRFSGVPVIEETRIWVPSPPFVESISMECSPPEARFELHQSWKDVWLESTTPGVVDRLIWDFGDGTIEGDTPLVDQIPDHSVHHRYTSPGRYTINLTAVGPFGTSQSNETVVVATPPSLREPRRSEGRRSP